MKPASSQTWVEAAKRTSRQLLGHPARGILYGFRSRPWAPMAFAPGHFHSSVPSLREIDEYRSKVDDKPRSLEGIDLNLDGQIALLRQLKPHIDAQPFGSETGAPLRFRFQNDWFSGYDPIVLYAVLKAFEPRRIIEVGSGWSTAAMLDSYGEHPRPEMTLIEPYPERLFSVLRDGDRNDITLLESRLQDVPLSRFEALTDRDVLFVDSTHVTKLGSDVNYLVFEVLPRLAPGVLVHFHDIGYPFEYEMGFVEAGYGWNEVYLLRAFLQYNHSFEIVLWNDLLRSLYHDLLKDEFPGLVAQEGPGFEGSLWLRRTAD